MKLYLEITRDKYQLPLAVAESPTELARMCGTTPKTIWQGIYNAKRFGTKRPRYIVVEVKNG